MGVPAKFGVGHGSVQLQRCLANGEPSASVYFGKRKLC